ncbi:hypothetical protein FXN61_47175 [Lentzea sp. PSKA42]|uniref:Uncharacterized protein n=1 Tax=Lentzea indica TaxID=2604800 RepID=A0ABX1FYY4_9PSEU|nr:hypothetical protein [Lentzea indica]NKE63882.1 hypothetical protein [Lentzea indica]
MGNSEVGADDDAGKRQGKRRRRDTARFPAATFGAFINSPMIDLFNRTIGQSAALHAAMQPVGVKTLLDSPAAKMLEQTMGIRAAIDKMQPVGVETLLDSPAAKALEQTMGIRAAIDKMQPTNGFAKLLDSPGYNFAAAALGLSNGIAAARFTAPITDAFLGLDRSAAGTLHNATGGLLDDQPLRDTFIPPARSASDEQLSEEPLVRDPQLASIIAELSETVRSLQEQLAESARQGSRSQSSTVVAGAMLIGLVLLLALSAAVHEGAPEVHGKINEIVELPSNIYSYLMCIAMGVMALGIRRR